jgi:hypothetical protein
MVTTIRRRFKVKSTNIRSLGYDPLTKAMEVTFHGSDDAVYTYQNISPMMYAELMNAESIGEWFHNQIKAHKNSYPFMKSMTKEKHDVRSR